MTDPRYIGTILYVGLAIFAALLAAGLLMQERRRSVQKAALLWGAEGLILLLDLYLCFGLLPAPLRLPVSLTVGFLSYSAVFIAVSADGFWKKVYLLITFFCVCCISWSGGLYLCYFLLPDRPMAVKYLVRTALHIGHGAADPAGLPEIRQAAAPRGQRLSETELETPERRFPRSIFFCS